MESQAVEVTDFRVKWVRNEFLPLLDEEMAEFTEIIESVRKQIELVEDLESNERELVKIERNDEKKIKQIEGILGDVANNIEDLEDALENGSTSVQMQLENNIVDKLEDAETLAREIDENQRTELQEAEQENQVIAEVREQHKQFQKMIETVESDEFSQVVRMENAVKETAEAADPTSEVGQAFGQALSRIKDQGLSVVELRDALEEYDSKLDEDIKKSEQLKQRQKSNSSGEHEQLEAEIKQSGRVGEKLSGLETKIRQEGDDLDEIKNLLNKLEVATNKLGELEEILEESNKLKKSEVEEDSSIGS